MSDLVEFRSLKNLITVAEEGNITRAAKRLYISQPCLSGQMKHLEEALQVSLFVRDSAGVRATPAAEILIAGSRHLLKLRDDLLATTRARAQCFIPAYAPRLLFLCGSRSLRDGVLNPYIALPGVRD
jgi:DNA-binding transcriptional LysR family regulator